LKRAIKLSAELERKVNERTQELKEQNIKIMDSIDYAKKLQETIIASEQEMCVSLLRIVSFFGSLEIL